MDETPLDRKELKSRSLNGAVVNVLAQVLKLSLMFLNQVVMARLLSPQDFGLLAMVAPIMAFVVLFADLGLSQATIQRPKISQVELSFLFWTNVAVATTLALIMMLIAPLVGLFYHEPRVVAITLVMGSSLILTGLSSQHTAIFTRNMEFRKIVSIDIGAIIVGYIAGIFAALSGLEYWSLVIIHMTIYITNMICVWSFSTWRPGRPELPEEWKALLGFGGNLSGFNFVNYFARNLDNVLIGRVHGEVQLGFYDRAYKLLLMPLTQITQPFARIALPLLSRTREEPEIYRKAYLRMLEVIMFITYPVVIFSVVEYDTVIRTVLGEKWANVGPIFALLGATAFQAIISHTTGWLFISQDRTREMRDWGIFSSVVIILSFVAGLPWGPLGVAAAYLAVTSVQGPIIWWASTRKGPVAFSDLLKLCVPFTFALVVSAICIRVLGSYILSEGVFALLCLFAFSYAIFAVSFYMLPSGRKIINELLRHTMTMVMPLWRRYILKT